jgi:transcriptional regulator NrdR family protein
MYKVIKKDGTEQDFDRGKIINGVQKSGATPEIAEAVAAEVEAWLPGKAVDDKVSYIDLKIKVIETIRSKDSNAADAFEAYTKQA